MEIFSDSRLVVGQVKGELEAKDMRMQHYLNQVRHLQLGFKSFSLQQIPRSRNTHAESCHFCKLLGAEFTLGYPG